MEAVLDRATQANAHTPEAGRVALTFFFNLAAKWKRSAEKQRILLGALAAPPSTSTAISRICACRATPWSAFPT